MREPTGLDAYYPEEDPDPGDAPWARPRGTLRPHTGVFEPGDDAYNLGVFERMVEAEEHPPSTCECFACRYGRKLAR